MKAGQDEDAEGSELSDSFEGPDDDGVSVDLDDSAVGHVEDDEEGRASLIGEDEALDEQTDSNGDEGWIGIGNSTIGDKNVVSEDSSAQSVGHSPMMKAPVSSEFLNTSVKCLLMSSSCWNEVCSASSPQSRRVRIGRPTQAEAANEGATQPASRLSCSTSISIAY